MAATCTIHIQPTILIIHVAGTHLPNVLAGLAIRQSSHLAIRLLRILDYFKLHLKSA